MKSKLLILILGMASVQSYGFDLEDYATTYRATRDAYVKAANELALAEGPFRLATSVMLKMEEGCFRMKDNHFENYQGLKDGTCAKDGQLPYQNGGPKLASNAVKVGDKLALLINSLPVTVSAPNYGWSGENSVSVRYGAWRDQEAKAFSESKTYAIEEIPGCVPTNLTMNRAFKKAVIDAAAASDNDVLAYFRLSDRSSTDLKGQFDINDYVTTYRATRDAFLKATNELQLAIGPYMAAKEAYQSASAVYTMYERCEGGSFGRKGYQLQDPYVWPAEQQ